jgi:hypothetical protein
MNTNATTGGLSARQRTITNITKITGLLSRISLRALLIAIACMLFSSCDTKTKGQESSKPGKDHVSASRDSLTKPKVNIRVNRRYDDKGNMIGFDSTYSSFYSNVEGDTLKMDSLMQSFDTYFKRNRPSFFDNNFNNLFFGDSTRYPDFFHNDYFLKRYELNDEYLRQTMKQMDSIKNRFFSEQHLNRKDPRDL